MLRHVALGGVLLLLLAGFYGFRRLNLYVSENPGFCAHCHKTSPEFSAWTQGQHRGTPCQSCHHSSPEQGMAMLRTFLLNKPRAQRRPHAEVEVGACSSCHLSHDPNWPQVGASRGHRIHALEQKIPCVRCHASGIHHFEPAAASCKECHGPHTISVKGMQQVHCFACHNFTTAGEDLKPTRHDCLACHRAQGVLKERFPDDAPMQFACSSCHKPHAPAQPLVACESCHASIAGDESHRASGHQRCADCHHAHGWRTERADCLHCHDAHRSTQACGDCHLFRSRRPTPE